VSELWREYRLRIFFRGREFQLAHFFPQVLAGNSESGGGLLDATLVIRERLLDEAPLGGTQMGSETARRDFFLFINGWCLAEDIGGREHRWSGSQDAGPLDAVPQFAHVAGPEVICQGLACRRVQAVLYLGFGGELVHEAFGQPQDVFPALAYLSGRNAAWRQHQNAGGNLSPSRCGTICDSICKVT
jgi:hypothetical protein